MSGAGRKSVAASQGIKTTQVRCWPSVDRLTRIGCGCRCRCHKQPSRRRDQVDGIRVGWCRVRSIVSSLSNRVAAGIAGRRRTVTSSNASATVPSRRLCTSNTVGPVKERCCDCGGATLCATDAKQPDVDGVRLSDDVDDVQDGTDAVSAPVGEHESKWRRQGEASRLWADVQKLCNMCVLSLSWNFFVSHDKYIARPSSKWPH